jgi:arylsulfatase A-like enzyme
MNKIILPLLTGMVCGLPSAFSKEVKKPNVIVIIVDDLGSGDVSCLLRDVVKTPNIDRLAKSGVTFTSGSVPVALCGPSRAAILTGQYPQRFGFADNGGGIQADVPLLPGVLHQAGYYTAHIGKWHSKGPMPHERGAFDESLCSPVSSPFIDYFHPSLARNGKVETSNEYSTDLFAREAVEFIDRNKERPFALTLAFNAPHILKMVKNAKIIAKEYDASIAAGKPISVPYFPMAKPEDMAKFVGQFPNDSARANVVATIYALDQGIGRILDKLSQTGLDKNTIVFFIGDNGGHPENRSENLPLREYKWSVFEGGVRTPFFAVYPGVFPAGLRYDKPVSSLDIFATCAALTGTKTAVKLDGVDLTPYITGKIKKAPHETLFYALNGLGAVRQDHWKLVMDKDGKSLLFDLSKDVEEKNNLASVQSDLVAKMKEKWEQWFSQMPERN